MGGVRANRKASKYFRRAYLCVSAICAVNPAGPIVAFARAGDPIFTHNYLNRPQHFMDAASEAIS